MSPVTWLSAVLDALPVRARKRWAPVGGGALRQGGVLVTQGRPLPSGAGSVRAWFVVPAPEAAAWWAAWQRAGADPASPEVAPWRELLVDAGGAEQRGRERTYTTVRGRELRYRAPGARFGDPRDG